MSPICIGMTKDPQVITAAFERGVNFFFLSADLHWPHYSATRHGLISLLTKNPSARDSIVLAVVSYSPSGFCASAFVDLVLSYPILKRFDVLVAGGTRSNDFKVRCADLSQCVKQNLWRARAVATTVHDRKAVPRCLSDGDADWVLFRYNPLHPGGEVDVLPFVPCSESKLLFTFKSVTGVPSAEDYVAAQIGDDYWRPRPQDAYRFALSQPAIQGVLCSPGSPSEVVELEAALSEPPLTPEERTSMKVLAKSICGLARRRSLLRNSPRGNGYQAQNPDSL